MNVMIQLSQTLTNVVHMAARLGTAVCVVFTLLGFFDAWVYGEQLASLRPYLGVSAGLAVLWFVAFRRWPWALAAAALVALNLWGTATAAGVRSQHRSHGEDLRVLVINAYFANPDQTRLARLAADSRADLVLVSELDDSLKSALSAVYPSVVTADSGGVSGMGVFSTYPLTQTQVIRSAHYGLPMISAVVHLPEGPARLMLVHPLPPGNILAFEERNALIRDVARQVSTENLPVIVAGDFNTTTWSNHLKPLLGVAERVDTPGTWPAHLPLRIPIDHLFFKGFGQRAVFEFLEDYGTDHVPFLVVLE